MSVRRRRSLWLPALFALGGCAGALPRVGGATTGATAVSPDWPEIALADLEGRPITLAEVLAGRPALVNLWAPWCERCKTELPDLDRLSRQFDGCAVVVGVAVGEEAPRTATFVREHGLGYPQVVDESFRLADALRQRRIPTTIVIDRGGAIVYVGPSVDQAAVGALESTLARSEERDHCRGKHAARSTQAPTNLRGCAAGFRGHDASRDRLPRKRGQKTRGKTTISWLSGIEHALCRFRYA